jgi:hypothetical protein
MSKDNASPRSEPEPDRSPPGLRATADRID